MTYPATGGPSCTRICHISVSPFGTRRDISQMCLQLAGCSQHHPLTWNVSWGWDNLHGFLLSHHKEPQRGTALLWTSCTHLWGRFRAADNKEKKEATSEEYFSLLTSRLMWLVSTWLRLLLHVRFSFQWCSSRPGSAAVTRVATLSWKSQMRRWTLSVHRWRFFSSRVHGWNTSMCHGLTCSGFESRYGSNILIFNTQRFGKLNAQKSEIIQRFPWNFTSLATLRSSRDTKTLSWNPD